MDKEQEAAQELTKDDLLAMMDRGRPASIRRRPRDTNQLAKAVVDEATQVDFPALGKFTLRPAYYTERITRAMQQQTAAEHTAQ